MVDEDLSTQAADAIEMLLNDCQNGKRPSITKIREYMELADELRGAGSDEWPGYKIPDVGQTVYDRDKGGRVPMEVVGEPEGRADEVVFREDRTVADENKFDPNEAPVIPVQFSDYDTTYHYPVTRLEW